MLGLEVEDTSDWKNVLKAGCPFVQISESIHVVGKWDCAVIGEITMSDQRKTESIVFLERNTFKISFRRPNFDHEWIEYGETSTDELVMRLGNATIAICNKVPMRAETLTELSNLRLIAVAATGVDNVDLEFCKSRRISVCNTRGYAIHSLPEHALMLMLALRRSLIPYRSDVMAGSWHKARQFCLLDHPINDLHGAVLGIIGHGALGRSMAQLASALGMEVLIAERKNVPVVREGRTKFEDVLQRSDVISLHCPLTEETRNLIGVEELKLMKSDAVLINTARGGLIDDAALVEALLRGEIGGAGVDVLRVEPPRSPSPLLDVTLPNLIVTPHNAWASRQATQTLADQLIESIEAFVRGEPRNLVV